MQNMSEFFSNSNLRARHSKYQNLLLILKVTKLLMKGGYGETEQDPPGSTYKTEH